MIRLPWLLHDSRRSWAFTLAILLLGIMLR